MENKPIIKIATLEVGGCMQCPHYSQGFLSEPNECGYFHEPYKWLTPRDGIPEWCPLPDKTIND